MNIAVLGHFSEYSTETQIANTLEHILGYDVIRVHENPQDDERFVEACKKCVLVILVGSHHRRSTAFATLHDLGVRTCSLHLDKFVGIPDREDLLGWQFQTDKQFTADPEIRLSSHVWLPPAIAEQYCFRGLPRDEWKCDVAFVGAVDSYHKEHDFRRRLRDWLQAVYGEGFVHIGGDVKIHGRDLNDFYAGAKVVVGDWFASGLPYYWSDRVPETCGRAGFLLVPKTEGLDYPGLATYTPQDLYDLQRQIDFWLANPVLRRHQQDSVFAYVRSNETYTHRMRQIIKEMGL
jgi:hypothetical protein